MAGLSFPHKLLKLVHPEGIPWPGTAVYNLVSATDIFQRNYELVAQDIVNYCVKGRLLDIGTGPGWLLLKLHHASPKLCITGLDASAAMVAEARRNIATAGLTDAVDVQDGNASQIPFPDEAFDIVVSTGSIHHWKEPVTGLNEVHRVLKGGGHALIYDILSDTPETILKETRREFGRLRAMLLWLHTFEEPFYSRDNFEKLADISLFREGQTRFVGVLCCLTLKKTAK